MNNNKYKKGKDTLLLCYIIFSLCEVREKCLCMIPDGMKFEVLH